MPKNLPPSILATKRIKVRILLGVQKPFRHSLFLAHLLRYNFILCIFCVHFFALLDLLHALHSLHLFLYFKYSCTPYPLLKSGKSSHAQLKSHYFFSAPIPYWLLDLIEQNLLLLLLYTLPTSWNQVLIIWKGFPKVIYAAAELRQLLVINKCCSELEELNQGLSYVAQFGRMLLGRSDSIPKLET